MNARSALLPLFLALGSSVPAAVAEVRYRSSVDFSHKVARDLAVDRDGSILVSTDSGIVRWDGTRMEQFLLNGTSGAMYRDRHGNLWTEFEYFGPDWERLVRIDPAGNRIALTSNTWIFDLAEDDTGVIWVATQDGVFAFRDTSLLYHPTFKTDSLDDYLNSLAFDDSGNLWVAGCRGIARISPDRKISYVKPEGWVQSIRKAPDGAMWASTSEGLFRWDGTSWNTMAGGGSNHIAFGSDGRLYLRSGTSVLVWNGSELDTFCRVGSGTPGSAPLVADSRGRIWTIADTSVLVEIDLASGRALRHPLFEDGFPGRSIYSVREDSLGRVWVASNGGLSLHTPQGRRTFPVVSVYGMAEPRAGEIWGMDYHNQRDIFRFADDSISHLTPSTNINGVVSSPNGEVAAYDSRSIYRYKGTLAPVVEQVDSISGLESAGFCPDGRLVVGGNYTKEISWRNYVTWYGLWKPSEGKWIRDISTYDSPRSIFCDGQGEVWFQTLSGGWFRRRGNTLRQISIPSSTFSVALVPSPRGRPFLVASSGVFQLDARDSIVPVPGWDSASVRTMGLSITDIGHSFPAGAEALWVASEAKVLFLDDAPWRGEVGIGPSAVSRSPSPLSVTRRISGWTATWSGTQEATLLATDLAGRTVWSGKVDPGESVSFDRPERFLVLRALSAGSPAEVRKLAAP